MAPVIPPAPPPMAACGDCGRPLAPDPTFSVLRCVPCGIDAGRKETARLRSARLARTSATTPTPGGPHA
jgi:predicted RNA-binding Zn-ribbon protein involved in translation (DUF1610 family)